MNTRLTRNEWSDAARAAAIEARRRNDLEDEAEQGGSGIVRAAKITGGIVGGVALMALGAKSPQLLRAGAARTVSLMARGGAAAGRKLFGTPGVPARMAEVAGRGNVFQPATRATRGLLRSGARQAALRSKLVLRRFR